MAAAVAVAVAVAVELVQPLMDQAGLVEPVEVEQTGLTELMVVPMTAAMVVAVAAGEMAAPCQPISVTTMTP